MRVWGVFIDVVFCLSTLRAWPSCFESTSILLFLNKRDLFTTKIAKVGIASQPAFADYDGKPNDFEDGVRYFEEKFTSQSTNEQVVRTR